MIIVCPKCRTKFHLADSRIPPRGGKVRCSLCREVFVIPKEPAFAPAAEIPRREEPPAFPGPADPPIPRRSGPANRFLWLFLLFLLLLGGAFALFWKTPYLRQAESFFSAFRESLGLSDSSAAFISLENLRGYYAENAHLGWIFVVEGQAVNQWDESRSFLKVKGTLLDSKGRKVEEKTAFCGNVLGEKDLREMTREAIQKSLTSQFGVSFSNVNVPPRKSVPFMVVFTDFAQNEKENPSGASPSLSDFSVEVIGSKKGSK